MDNKKPIDVLLVEDNPGDIRLILEAFKESNLQINMHVVMDGSEAINYLKKKENYANSNMPHLIILDLNLPKKTGREVLQIIKLDPVLKLIPVVVLTISQSEKDIFDSYSSHANCYITKPLDFEKFMVVINAIEKFWFDVVRLPPRIL